MNFGDHTSIKSPNSSTSTSTIELNNYSSQGIRKRNGFVSHPSTESSTTSTSSGEAFKSNGQPLVNGHHYAKKEEEEDVKSISVSENNRKNDGEFEKCDLIDSLMTYLCYAIIVIVGYFKDLIFPPTSKEKNRPGYVPLFASFESFYTRHVYRRIKDCWNTPIASVPGAKVTIMERETNDFGWTFKLTGTTQECINMGSYNYLGFAENNVGICQEEAIQSIRKYGIACSSTRTELGETRLHRELERAVAKFVGQEDALICPMGYATNAFNIPCLIHKETLVLSDSKNHASIIVGLRLSKATVRVFRHNDMNSLEKKLKEAILDEKTKRTWSKILIVVEGVYSMEGSIVNLPRLIALKKKYGAYLYLDEAHSIGALGEHGRGVVDYWGVNPKDVDILMGTFTKSFCSAGGYIAGSSKLIRVLRNNSISHHYGAVMSPPIVQQVLTTMRILSGEDGTNNGLNRIRQLAENSRYFRQNLKKMGFIVYGNEDSPIIPIALYLPSKIAYFTREMRKRGIAAVSVGFPATRLTEGRTRFCISSSHTKEDLDKVLQATKEVGEAILLNKSKRQRPSGEITYKNVWKESETLD